MIEFNAVAGLGCGFTALGLIWWGCELYARRKPVVCVHLEAGMKVLEGQIQELADGLKRQVVEVIQEKNSAVTSNTDLCVAALRQVVDEVAQASTMIEQRVNQELQRDLGQVSRQVKVNLDRGLFEPAQRAIQSMNDLTASLERIAASSEALARQEAASARAIEVNERLRDKLTQAEKIYRKKAKKLEDAGIKPGATVELDEADKN